MQVRKSNSLHKNTYGDNYYATNNSEERIIRLIKKMPKGRQINLIGHSWGADTAADIVANIPNRIHTLITIDPVSYFVPDLSVVRNNTNKWININAVSPLISGGDIAALFGSPWNDSPKGYANIHIHAPYTHEQFTEMMIYAPKNGKASQITLNGN